MEDGCRGGVEDGTVAGEDIAVVAPLKIAGGEAVAAAVAVGMSLVVVEAEDTFEVRAEVVLSEVRWETGCMAGV